MIKFWQQRNIFLRTHWTKGHQKIEFVWCQTSINSGGIPTQPPNREFQLHAETIAWCCCGAANGLKLAMRKDSVMTSCSAGPHGADIPRGSIPKKHKEMIGHMWYAFLQPFIRQSKMQGIFEFKWQSVLCICSLGTCISAVVHRFPAHHTCNQGLLWYNQLIFHLSRF